MLSFALFYWKKKGLLIKWFWLLRVLLYEDKLCMCHDEWLGKRQCTGGGAVYVLIRQLIAQTEQVNTEFAQ